MSRHEPARRAAPDDFPAVPGTLTRVMMTLNLLDAWRAGEGSDGLLTLRALGYSEADIESHGPVARDRALSIALHEATARGHA